MHDDAAWAGNSKVKDAAPLTICEDETQGVETVALEVLPDAGRAVVVIITHKRPYSLRVSIRVRPPGDRCFADPGKYDVVDMCDVKLPGAALAGIQVCVVVQSEVRAVELDGGAVECTGIGVGVRVAELASDPGCYAGIDWVAGLVDVRAEPGIVLTIVA